MLIFIASVLLTLNDFGASPALQSRASPLYLPEIYSVIDFFPLLCSSATFKTQGNITS